MPMEIVAKHYRTGEPVRITIENGRILSVQPAGCDADGLDFVSPGWIDLQVNGYGGHDLNRFPLQPETVADLTRELFKVGVTRYCPTVITGSRENIAQAFEAIRLAAERYEAVRRSIAGIHLEGPYLSEKDGSRGAHNKAYIRDPQIGEFEYWQSVSGGLIKLVTVAPERRGALDFIRYLRDKGVAAAIGHTAADTDTIAAAAEAGAAMSTHLGNGSEVYLHRHRNYVFAQLADDRLWAAVIADGFHLPPALLKIFMRTKREKLFLVSDSTAFAGMPPGVYKSEIGGEVCLSESGKLHVKDNPEILAGSASPMVRGIENMVKFGICGLAEAVEMACVRPALALGLPEARLAPGEPSDLVLFRWHEEESRIEVTKTISGGRAVFEREN
jgi:N-acetylglucosamine-6-phosphate deacetylase